VRALIPPTQGPVDLHSWYGDSWSRDGGVRLNMIESADGAAMLDGKSGGLQTPGDNRTFAALRDLADVIVAGSGTVRAEGYGPAVPSEDRQRRRIAQGYRAVPRIALVSDGLNLDLRSPLFVDAAPDARTIVITSGAAEPDRLAALDGLADVVAVGAGTVDLAAAMAELRARGLRRILCEGGPTLLASMVRAEAADELCVTISPKLAGPGPGRIAAGAAWTGWAGVPVGLGLTHLLEEDGALFARYAIERAAIGRSGNGPSGNGQSGKGQSANGPGASGA
jgi:riboflavin biosynthesis pyrimidine reductase